MSRGFWTTGPVPLLHLDELALVRPRASTEIQERLAQDGIAHLGGNRGDGRTTLAHQIIRAIGRESLILDGAALLETGPEILDRALRRELGLPPGADPWERLAGKTSRRQGRLLVLDRPPAPLLEKVEAQADRRAPVLVVEDGGPLRPDPIPDGAASLFLQRRARSLGIRWSPEALEFTVDAARGSAATLQWLGHLCCHGVGQTGPALVTEEDAWEGAATAAHHLPTALASALGPLGGQQLRLLKAMARRPGGTPTEWAELCGIEPKAASVHLARLTESGLVEKVARGRYEPASPLVERHLRLQYGTAVRRLKPA